MINSRLEAKNLRIWLICIALVAAVAIVACAAVGFIGEERLYEIAPFLDFGLVVTSAEIFGYTVPTSVTDKFNFACSLTAVWAAFALVLHMVYVIVLNCYRIQRGKATKVLRKNGYCREYYDLLERKHRKLKNTSLGAKNDLLLAKAYADGRRYDDAFAVLRDIDTDDFNAKSAAAYYNLYARLFVLTGNVEGALQTLKMGDAFVRKYADDSDIRLTLAIIKYAKGEYEETRKRLESLLTCKPVETRVWAGLYLGLVYLRLHKKELAKKLAVTLGTYKKTPRQSEDMLKLIKKIEAAYMLEEQEAKEAATV